MVGYLLIHEYMQIKYAGSHVVLRFAHEKTNSILTLSPNTLIIHYLLNQIKYALFDNPLL